MKKHSFTPLEFTYFLMEELNQQQLISFSEKHLERALYYYAHAIKYQSLFANLPIDRKTKRIVLTDYLLYLNILNGQKNFNSQEDQKKVSAFLQADSLSCQKKQQICLIKEMGAEYCLINKVEKKNKIPLQIHHLHPDGSYQVVRGYHQNREICWNVITDGDYSWQKNGDNPLQRNVFYRHPQQLFSSIYLTNCQNHSVLINEASFTILQGSIDHKITSAMAFTTQITEKKLNQIASQVGKRKDVFINKVKVLSLQ